MARCVAGESGIRILVEGDGIRQAVVNRSREAARAWAAWTTACSPVRMSFAGAETMRILDGWMIADRTVLKKSW